MKAPRRQRDPLARALDWLARRDRSERELRDRLRQWGAEPEEVEAVMAKLSERGLVDDRAFADKLRDWHCRHDPVGPLRFSQKLRQRGVTGETAAAATEPLRDLDLQRELARGLLLKRLPSLLALEPEARTRRMRGYLARRGFAEAVVRELCIPLLRDDLSLEDYDHDPQ